MLGKKGLSGMRIDVSKIPSEGILIDLDLQLDEIDTSDLKETIVPPLHFKGSIIPASDGFIISGEFSGDWILECARCLSKLQYPVRDRFRVYMSRRLSGLDTRKLDLAQEQLDESELTGNQIDLGNLIREQMILHIPIKATCRNDCKGLCPVCGVNRNQVACDCGTETPDPRLMKLKQLLEK